MKTIKKICFVIGILTVVSSAALLVFFPDMLSKKDLLNIGVWTIIGLGLVVFARKK